MTQMTCTCQVEQSDTVPELDIPGAFEEVFAEFKVLDNDGTGMLRSEELVAVLKEVVNLGTEGEHCDLYFDLNASKKCTAITSFTMSFWDSLERVFEKMADDLMAFMFRRSLLALLREIGSQRCGCFGILV